MRAERVIHVVVRAEEDGLDFVDVPVRAYTSLEAAQRFVEANPDHWIVSVPLGGLDAEAR